MRSRFLTLRLILVIVAVLGVLKSDSQADFDVEILETPVVERTIVIPKILPTAEPTGTPRVYTPTPTSTFAVTTTPQPSLTATPISLPTYHVVKTGDTLAKIAEYYGVPITYIAYKNEIQNMDLIYVGQELLVENPENGSYLFAEDEKTIVVKLSTQTLTAYEYDTEVAQFSISSGVAKYPTITGTFYVYAKYEKTRMTAYDYDIPNVPWTMYYFEGYAIHGAPWHNNFGTPMSHGCVNMAVPDAKWLFEWAPYYTVVEVIY